MSAPWPSEPAASTPLSTADVNRAAAAAAATAPMTAGSMESTLGCAYSPTTSAGAPRTRRRVTAGHRDTCGVHALQHDLYVCALAQCPADVSNAPASRGLAEDAGALSSRGTPAYPRARCALLWHSRL